MLVSWDSCWGTRGPCESAAPPWGLVPPLYATAEILHLRSASSSLGCLTQETCSLNRGKIRPYYTNHHKPSYTLNLFLLGGKCGNESRLRQMGVPEVLTQTTYPNWATWSLQVYTCHHSISKKSWNWVLIFVGQTWWPMDTFIHSSRRISENSPQPRLTQICLTSNPRSHFWARTRFRNPKSCWHHRQHPPLKAKKYTKKSTHPSHPLQSSSSPIPQSEDCRAMCERLQICRSGWSLVDQREGWGELLANWFHVLPCSIMFYSFPYSYAKILDSWLIHIPCEQVSRTQFLDLCESKKISNVL